MNAANQVCPKCGARLPANSPSGLCARCLMAVNLATQTVLSGEAAGTPEAVKPAPPSPEEIARHFPGFDILDCLGRGGMGVVYRARQRSLNRVVALKILAPERERNAAFAQRFATEAGTLARLNHPGIVTVYDFGQANGMFYFVMEFVDGVSLRQLLSQGRVAPREALAIVPEICDALQYAHDQGIVHRDIKPENILLDRRGRVKVADFGLAKLVKLEANGSVGAASPGEPRPVRPELHTTILTEAGKVMGTPQYMAPEQVEEPAEVDHRADIYALGVVFYQMLTGELPGRSIEPPSKKVQMDVRLDEVVLRALERKPELRFQQVSDLKTCVETIAGTSSPQVEAKTAKPPAGGSPRLSRRLLVGFAVAMLAIVAGVVLAMALKAFQPERTGPGPSEVIVQTIQNQVGRELREAGATYDDLQVTVAVRRSSGTPYKVSYSGLRNFKGNEGTTPDANGSFVMEYVGRGQWQGALAGMRFTVTVGSKDKIDLPFVNDPQVIGEWKSVDFVADISNFNPERPISKGKLHLKGLTFLENGKTPQSWYTWTRGFLIHHGDQTASHYEIREIKGQSYLFLEWKSGDVTIAGMKPHYYVLNRKE